MNDKRVTIDRATLKRYVRQGLTQEQMREAFHAEHGVLLSRAAFAMAMKRYEIEPKRKRARYTTFLPWQVRVEHTDLYPARMLRLLGARENGKKLTEDQTYRLDTWLRGLAEDQAVITYRRNTHEGFFRVPREPGDDPKLPIRRPETAAA